MPTIGVYCTMACADYQPPRLLSASESEEILSKSMVPFVTDYCPYLDEDDWSDTKVEIVNKPFDMSKVILST